MDTTCTVDTCPHPVRYRQLCRAHYKRLIETGDVQADKPIRHRTLGLVGAPCTAAGCTKAGKVNGLCPRHLAESFRGVWPEKPAGICIVPECPDKALCSGWCRGHYRRQQRRGDLGLADPIRKEMRPIGSPCIGGGCSKPVRVAKLGLCRNHYHAQRAAAIKADPLRHEAVKKYQREHKAAEMLKDPERVRARQRAWKARNPDKVKLIWADKQRRRAAARKLKFSIGQLRQKLEYWGNRCWICGGPYQAIDHVKPIARGGWHALMNLRPICTPCNSSKGYRWPFPTSTAA